MVNNLSRKNISRQNVLLSLEDAGLDGELSVPDGAQSIVMFVHGSGSSRFSRRNRFVAGELNKCGLATLLFDLMTSREEEIDRVKRLKFDIGFLARRVAEATRWLSENPDTQRFRIGYFGASTGAAAALVAAAGLPKHVHAIVSRGGRPDLAGNALPTVMAPTLFIVGSNDVDVLSFNRKAASQMKCENHMRIIQGASHLFEEEGALERVSELAGNWFGWYLDKR